MLLAPTLFRYEVWAAALLSEWRKLAPFVSAPSSK